MTSDRWDRVQDLFEAALERPEASRASFVAEECGGDESLRKEVLSLLQAHDRTDPMLDTPVGIAAGDPRDEPLAPGTKLGEYEVQALIGTGGFGRVYRGIHPVIRKQAAIKVLYPQFSASPEHAARFINEARTVNEIGHPDIIDVFAFGETEDGGLYFVMELLDAPTLAEHIENHAPLSVADALAVLRPLAAAVDAAHDRGVVHRDLKPANVLLVEDPDGNRRPKLLDFGIAKLRRGATDAGATASGEETAEGQILGTPAYMSPEQARGVAVDRATDVYALGVIAYEMLTGQRPHQGGTPLELLMKHVTEDVAPASTLAEVPAHVDGALAAMLAKEPSARPPSCRAGVEALAAEMQDAANEEVVTPGAASEAPPPTRPDLVWGRRVFVFAALAIPIAVVAWRVSAQRDLAAHAASRDEGHPDAQGEPDRAPADAESPSDSSPQDAEPEGSAPASPPPPERALHEQPAEPASPEPCSLEVSGAPEGTEAITAGGTRLGPVPGTLELPAGTEPIELNFSRRGYRDAQHTVVPCTDTTLELSMPRKGKRLNPDLESPFKP